MNTGLKWFPFPLTLAACAIAACSTPVAADSTADLIMNLKCEGSTSAEIWKNRKTGGLLFRATSPAGKMVSYLGKTKKTEGVKVYQFQDGSTEYWVWDGDLDNPQAVWLETYKNGRQVQRQSCQRL